MRTVVLLCSMLVVAISGLVCDAGAGCLSYGAYLHALGAYTGAQYARDMVLVDSRLVVADWQREFSILDASDPSRMALLGSLQLPSEPRGMDAHSAIACVSLDSREIQLIDIADPGSPAAVGSLAMPSGPRGLALAGDYAFVTASQFMGEEGVYVVDVSAPEHPWIVTRVEVGTIPDGIVIDGALAYVRTFYEIVVLDIVEPTAPVIIGRIEMPGQPGYLAFQGDYLYVVCESTEGDRYWGNGLYIVDRTDPAALRIVGSYAPEEEAPHSGIALWGDYAISSCGNLGIGFFDVADPTRPALVEYLGIQDYARPLIVHGDVLFGGGDGIVSYALTADLARPPVTPIAGTEQCVDFAVSGDYAYMLRSFGEELLIVDLRDPQVPAIAGRAPLDSDYSSAIAVTEEHPAGPFVYVGGNGHPDTTLIFDASDPTAPARVGELVIPRHPADLDVVGRYLYAAAGAAGVRIYDIAKPETPELVSVIDFDYSPSTITVVGERLYVGRRVLYFENLFIYDIADPADPVLLGLTQIAKSTHEVVIDGNLAFIADGTEGLLILDVGDPANLREVSRTRGIGELRDLFLDRGIVYATVMGGNAGAHLIDVNDPVAPRIIGFLRTGQASAIERIGDHALVADRLLSAVVAPLECAPALVEDAPRIVSAIDLRLSRNPARGELEIDLSLPGATAARLALFDPAGREVRVLREGRLERGTHRVRWDGKDQLGRRCAAGVYFVQVRTAGRSRGQSLVYFP